MNNQDIDAQEAISKMKKAQSALASNDVKKAVELMGDRLSSKIDAIMPGLLSEVIAESGDTALGELNEHMKSVITAQGMATSLINENINGSLVQLLANKGHFVLSGVLNMNALARNRH